MPKRSKTPMTRRRFLKIAGITGGGLVVLFAGGNYALRRFQAGVGENIPELPDDPNAWLKIGGDNRVRLFISKVEMGQGIGTAAAQIVADELDVPLDHVELAQADTTTMPADTFGTAGSASVLTMYPALRQACATARQVLMDLVAERAGKPLDRFDFRDGQITGWSGDLAMTYSYGDLVGDRQIVLNSKTSAPFKSPADYTVIGADVPRVDLPDKVTGKTVYGYDARVEGMLHGRVVRPPLLGATVDTVNLEAARGLPGVAALLHEDDFVGVAAETPDQASAAMVAIDVGWKQPERLVQQEEVEALLADGRDPHVLREAGDIERALAGSSRTFTARYRTGFASHGQIEPQAAVADVRANSATVWAPTQAPFSLQRQVAGATGLKQEQVTVVPTFLGGGFGRKTVSESAIEAARLSKAAGRPVRVAWNRAEEFAHGFTRPPTITDLSAVLDASGAIVGWQQHLATGFVLFTFFPTFLRFLFGSDFGATRGAAPPYSVPNLWVGATVKELPVKTGSWRGLGLGPNIFAVEQFVDELALAAGSDPVAFRLRHLPDDEEGRGQRLRRVIETAAEKAGWGSPLPPDHGRGIACVYETGTFVAEVAEVQVDRSSGGVQVKRVTAAIDCGLAINPRNVAAQTEGAIMMGLSAALKEEITLKDGRWQADSFGSYPIFTMADAPEIDVTVLQNHDAPPSGVGEPPLAPAAAAVGNAIAAATGARVRTMPMTPVRVLAALADTAS